MDDSFSDDKLCGFLFAVLAVTPSQPDPCASLSFKQHCDIFGDGSNAVGFRSENGVVLVPVDSAAEQDDGGNASPSDSAQCEVFAKEGQCKKENWEVSGSNSLRRKRMTKIGMVNGSVSVIHQLHALVSKRCLKIDARVVLVDLGDCGEARAVVLVDVYLPIALWSGWQFPRSGSTAGALFRHLRCDWDERRSILSCSDYIRKIQGANESIWSLCDCHVFGCKLHYHAKDSSKNSLFELHEIFKSIPGVGKERKLDNSRIVPLNDSWRSGIWELSDDILTKILAPLGPMDIARVSATCRHLRSLAASIMPYTKLKLFPHQQTAVEWMLHRERNAECLEHPLYVSFSTEDGFVFHINTVSGEIVIGEAPTIKDFCGGMFCDEPGLGKTVTALSLILKTQGTLAEPPAGANVVWCHHNGNLKCGYYDIVGSYIIDNTNLGKRDICQDARNNEHHDYSSKRARLKAPAEKTIGLNDKCSGEGKKSPAGEFSEQPIAASRCSLGLSCIKKNLCATFEEEVGHSKERKDSVNPLKLEHASNAETHVSENKPVGTSYGHDKGCKGPDKPVTDSFEYRDTWIQCDACQKWRKLADANMANTNAAWFCSMNTDPLYQSCSIPEQPWHNACEITYLPGFHVKGSAGGEKKNVSFFTSVLKEHYTIINSETKKALTWLARLPPDKLSEMEINGIRGPVLSTCTVSSRYLNPYHKIFQAFGLIKRLEKGVNKWYYPRNLNNNLAFDVTALGMALREPLDSFRLYLSRATLIVVPANLVDHWKTQIEKHVQHSQLRVYVWNDTWKWKPSVHSLAWDYDVVITTFSRLSAEWSPRKRSVLMQIHWLRIILDEGHTLGSSLNLTNKLQMAISLTASNRWILTGTPTPNTPKSQLSHLQPLLRFLHEEAYGLNPKSWEVGILKPFEAEMEEGRFRLLHLLRNCMISARKIDLHNIPPCIKKAVFLDFTEGHARSYNELVLTVRRNILMADWNDPSHIESLLNPKQWKFRIATIKNVRLSCCVAGHIKVTHAGEDIQETMDMLVGNGMDPDSAEYSSIRYNLLCGGRCVRCKEWCRLPFITPCRHLLCLDCVALDSMKCTYPGCNKLYEMQNPDTLARPENPNPKWPVPKDLIELQPSYKQDNWDPDWQSTSSSKVSYLVQRLKDLQESNKEKGYYSSNDQVLAESSCPLLMRDVKSSFQQCSPGTGPNNMPEKVLIFSQFLEHIHVIEQQLTIAGIKYTGMYSPMPLGNKKKSLATFQHDPSCMALVMDGSAALGLDLSFVTHVFLMEPIWDRSMEEQVISRAHRMGACRPIHVETLAMRGTIEEQMLEFLQDADRSRNSPSEAVVQCDDGKKFPTGAVQFEEGGRGRSLHDFAENSYLLRLRFVNTNTNALEGL
ncbi:F-box protein At3g54460 [Neltuma alba]|uniref:F-box protein At3g54460 n=1 Tax=Neltuma alba TaxID=207710 RepID=UPI0010A40E54|nr:F-box protein At3g54460 [Prosopis alba]